MRLSRKPRLPLALLAALAALALAACGDDGDGGGGDGGAQQLSFTLAGPTDIQAPQSAEAGVAELTFRNTSEEPLDIQLIRAEGEHSTQEVVDGLADAMRGRPFPDWFFAAGGAPELEPGAEETVTQVLEPGTYYAFNTTGVDGPPAPADVPSFEVSGSAGDAQLPDTGARVEAFEYGFDAEGLRPGRNEILFENTGEEPHHLIAAPIAAGSTIADVRAALREESGPPPIDEENEVFTAVIEGGDSQLVTLDLQRGRYALLCFISDRDGGPPHALQGMVSPTTVTGQ